MSSEEKNKSKFLEEGFNLPAVEEKILNFWEENKIFEKSLAKTKNGEPYTFYDGPPFATGLPHYGHILASTIKDLIPRYQTMKGRYVRRRWGWDCHGLPIEEIVERHLGISGKKQIEELGIDKFNATCREKVLEYAGEWQKMVRRIARWIEFDNSYKTMDRDYMESVWWAFKQFYEKGLVYEGRKVLMYCPRCETPVSNFEVAMDNSYKDVEEEAVTVKFRITDNKFQIANGNPAYILAWTTTPWTLPGNVALAVGESIEYALVESGGENYFLAQELVEKIFSNAKFQILKSGIPGKDLVGLEYEQLLDVPAVKNEKTFRVYPADFVTTADGTGVVHTAVVYGEDDYNLGQQYGLPVVPLLDGKGLFNDKAPELLRGQYFEKANKIVLENLQSLGLVFDVHKNMHSYPHCWRCGNKLFYNAIPAWFINIQKIKNKLIASNAKEISWYPGHLKHGRYEKSVEQAPDWNISRNRYWGNPVPVWKCTACGENKVVGSVKELGLSRNTFYFSRHGESETNATNVISCSPVPGTFDLTQKGVEQAQELGERLKQKGGVDLIVSSDLLRAKRTAEIVGEILGGAEVSFDARLRESNFGPEYNNQSADKFEKDFPSWHRLNNAPPGGESRAQVRARVVDCLEELNKKYEGKKILIVSHGDPLWSAQEYFGSELPWPDFAKEFELDVSIADLHRPGIDKVVLSCDKCGQDARRVPEIFDSWVEAGSMPFAEFHYPFDQKEVFEARFPGQFVAEYIAQTRAWFYVMHVLSLELFGKAPFENVVTTGTILAEDGSKMSKSKKNFPDPWAVIEKYGVDALRFYLMNSSVMQADNLNFSERELGDLYRKNILIPWNVLNYYLTYSAQADFEPAEKAILNPSGVLDKWIWVRTKELINGVADALDGYDTVRATRFIAEYIDDLSTWYLRRSRGRTDSEFFGMLRYALLSLAKVSAPVMPYLSELIYANLNNNPEAMSVHLSDWPAKQEITKEEESLLSHMAMVREAASAGMAIRKQQNVPVRQPLSSFKIKKSELKEEKELLEILSQELNVKTVEIDPALVEEAVLDLEISEDLRREGLVRGLERAVQEARKKIGLKVGESARFTYSTEDRDLLAAISAFNREKTFISEAVPGPGGEAVELDGRKISILIQKI